MNVSLPLHEAKKIKMLAVTSPERLSAAPDVATFAGEGADRELWLVRPMRGSAGTRRL